MDLNQAQESRATPSEAVPSEEHPATTSGIHISVAPGLVPLRLSSTLPQFTPDEIRQYFTVVVANSGGTVFDPPGFDGAYLLAQEAKTEHGEWKPIEFLRQPDCGLSRVVGSPIQPGQERTVAARRYSGDFKTELRIALFTGNEIVYSEPFAGSINRGQFTMSKDKTTTTVSELQARVKR